MKIESRMLPDEIDGIKFRTAFRTSKRQGVLYYSTVTMPSDLKIDKFAEDIDEEEIKETKSGT